MLAVSESKQGAERMTEQESQQIISEVFTQLAQPPLVQTAVHTGLYGALEEQADEEAVGGKVYELSNETGTGRITVYQVLGGIELIYNDLHLAYCNQHQPTAKNVIEINHCRVGRFECDFGENSCCYMSSGDLAIGTLSKRKAHTEFPLRHYHGISVIVCIDALDPVVREMMAILGIDLAGLRHTICDVNRCFIMRADESIEHIFSELYHARAWRKPGYRLLKTMELLLFLSDLDTAENVQQTEYFSRKQVEQVKSVAALITEDLTRHYTLAQLAERFGLSETALKKGFRGVFGTSVYAYLKQYRLETSQQLLLRTTLSVTEIAGRIGYENPNKFTTAFKKAYGLSPTEFRKCVQMDSAGPEWGGKEV